MTNSVVAAMTGSIIGHSFALWAAVAASLAIAGCSVPADGQSAAGEAPAAGNRPSGRGAGISRLYGPPYGIPWYDSYYTPEKIRTRRANYQLQGLHDWVVNGGKRKGR